MRILITLVALLWHLTMTCQNKQLLYNVNDLPQTLMSNPGANIRFDAHVGVPFLSQFHFAAGSTGVNIRDIFEAGGDINQNIRTTIRRLTNQDYFTVNQQLDVVNLGWRISRDKYISAGIYQELDLYIRFPKDPAILVSEGNSQYVNVPFDFSDVSFTSEVLTVYHMGINIIMDRQLTLGGRLKLYSGIFNAESINNTGTFLTESTPGGPNYYRHYATNVNLRANTSGFVSLRDNNETVQEATREVLARSMFGGNIGAGIDFGGTYNFRRNLIVTGSVQDLGLIWQRDGVENYTYTGTYQTDGLEPLFPGEGSGGAIPYWDIFEDEVERNLVDETLNESYITWRPFRLNASVEFKFGESWSPCDYRVLPTSYYHSRLGLQLFGIKRPNTFRYALTTYYDRRILQDLRLKVTYTLDDFSYTNFGLLVSQRYKNFNMYLAADNLFGYLNLATSHYQSIQVGMQFIFNR